MLRVKVWLRWQTVILTLKIITGTKSWCFAYKPVNTMLMIFFIWQGVVHKELVLKRRTVNSEFYRQVRDRLLKRFWHIRLDTAQFGNWFLQHDNAPSHNATISKQFLAKKNITVLDHPLTRQIRHLQTTFNSLK